MILSGALIIKFDKITIWQKLEPDRIFYNKCKISYFETHLSRILYSDNSLNQNNLELKITISQYKNYKKT